MTKDYSWEVGEVKKKVQFYDIKSLAYSSFGIFVFLSGSGLHLFTNNINVDFSPFA